MTGKVLAAAAAAAVALLSAGSALPRPHVSPAGPLGILGNSISMRTGSYTYLVRVNPRNLRPVPGQRLPLGPIAATWAYSPDRSRLAVGVEGPLDGGCDLQASLRFVDPPTLTAVGEVSLGAGLISATAWLSPDRVVAVVSDCGFAPRLVVVDSSARRVISLTPIPDKVNRIVAAGSRLVVMSSPADTIGPARLTVADGTGTSRVLVDRVDVGFDSEHVVWPGLALTRDGGRAFVVSPTGLVADVDLGSLQVAYHSIGRRRSLAGIPRIPIGSYRIAAVLPTGALVVAGADDVTYVDSSGQKQVRHLPAGLAFVDAKNWTAYTGDSSVDSFIVAGDTVLGGRATGLSGTVVSGDPRAGLFLGHGLSGYTLSGFKRFHLFGKQEVFVTVSAGGRSFVEVQEDRQKPGELLRVVDLRKKKVVGTRTFATLPWILQGQSSSG